MWDVLCFRKMVTPSLLQLLFWLLVALCLVKGILDLLANAPLTALVWFVVAPLILRVIVELLMCLFAINNQLNDLRHLLGQANHTEKKAP